MNILQNLEIALVRGFSVCHSW